jgi:N-acetyl-beta-hexosaminidase
MANIPVIIPSLHKWTSLGNYLTLSETCRLVIDPSNIDELSETAKILRKVFCAETKRPLTITIDSEPVRGDIILKLDRNTQEIGEQGYILEIDEHVKLLARTATGIFYGGQTLLQMLHQDPAHTQMPRGFTHDFPRFLQRGIMLDAGRKYWETDYLYKTVRKMARLKLNTLHLHLSDWSGFRLQSDRYPGLAIVPEIDLPAHATAFTRYNPSLAFASDVMSRPHWSGGEYGGFTLDYTNPRVCQWIKNLLDEFIPIFDGPYFHIGCDEVPSPDYPEQCPALADYARAKRYPHTTDVLVEWINEMNAFVKSYGKQTQIWNWWECTPHSINPDRDIIINAWVEAANPSIFLDAGYQVLNSPENLLYLSPGINLFPDCNHMYKEWSPSSHPNMLGYKLCVWADKCENESDEYFESLLYQPRAILAERTWNLNTPSGALEDFLTQANFVVSNG